MLSTDDHNGVLKHVIAADVPTLAQALRVARITAKVVTGVLRTAGIGPDYATVVATVTDDARPHVMVTITSDADQVGHHWHRLLDADPITAALPARASELARWIDAGGGGPPARRDRSPGRAA